MIEKLYFPFHPFLISQNPQITFKNQSLPSCSLTLHSLSHGFPLCLSPISPPLSPPPPPLRPLSRSPLLLSLPKTHRRHRRRRHCFLPLLLLRRRRSLLPLRHRHLLLLHRLLRRAPAPPRRQKLPAGRRGDPPASDRARRRRRPEAWLRLLLGGPVHLRRRSESHRRAVAEIQRREIWVQRPEADFREIEQRFHETVHENRVDEEARHRNRAVQLQVVSDGVHLGADGGDAGGASAIDERPARDAADEQHSQPSRVRGRHWRGTKPRRRRNCRGRQWRIQEQGLEIDEREDFQTGLQLLNLGILEDTHWNTHRIGNWVVSICGEFGFILFFSALVFVPLSLSRTQGSNASGGKYIFKNNKMKFVANFDCDFGISFPPI